jgi:hypothetical protein
MKISAARGMREASKDFPAVENFSASLGLTKLRSHWRDHLEIKKLNRKVHLDPPSCPQRLTPVSSELFPS